MANSKSNMIRQMFLPILGLMMLLGTLLWGTIQGAFSTPLMLMGAVAVALIALGLVWQERGSVRDTAASLVYCFFVLLAGVFLYLIVANNSRPVDLTRYRIHTLSEQTVQFLDSLRTPIRVTVFARQRDFLPLRTLCDLYEAESPMIDFELYDPEADISMAHRFGDNVTAGSAFAVAYDGSKELRRHRFRLELTDANQESILTNALLTVESGSDEKIYYLTGHKERTLETPQNAGQRAEEYGWEQFIGIITESVMPVEKLRLMDRVQVPLDAAVVVIAGPTSDLLDSERERLIQYLDEGGSVLVALDPVFNTASGGGFDNLRRVTDHAGIYTSNALLADPRGQPQQEYILTAPASDHPIVDRAGDLLMAFFMARPLQLDTQRIDPPGLSVTPLLVSANEVVSQDVEELMNRNSRSQSRDREANRYVLAAAASYPTPAKGRGDTARVVVFGDADFLADSLLVNEDHRIVGQHTINWLAMRDDRLAIPPRVIPPSSFVLTQKRLWLIIGSLLLIGLTVLVGGVSYTMARRRLG